MYPPLWTSLLVAMHDDIKNTSSISKEGLQFERNLSELGLLKLRGQQTRKSDFGLQEPGHKVRISSDRLTIIEICKRFLAANIEVS